MCRYIRSHTTKRHIGQHYTMQSRQASLTRKSRIRLLLVLAGIIEFASSEVAEVCTSEDFRLTCSRDEVILVTSAEYGRMRVGRCITEADEFLGCSNDVLPILDRWCSGRQDCSFSIDLNGDLDKANENCLKILIKYLKLEYQCTKVSARCSSTGPNRITEESGYISSMSTDTKGCGSSGSPWIISANPGQTVQLDLIDFDYSSKASNLVNCRNSYGFILERALGINHTICGGRYREGALYTSKTNTIEINILTKDRRGGGNFLLRYSVTGCPELSRPAHAWYKREGNEAVIGCENNDQEWRLTCTGNTWVGEVGNCSETVAVAKEDVPEPQVFHMSSVVVISGIAGGAVVLSVIAIVIGVVYINKYKMHQEMKRANLYKTYSTMDRNIQAYYRPVAMDQSVISEGWDMPLPPDPHAQMTSYPDPCTCATLQMRSHGDGNKIVGELDRQSLYSSIKST